MRRVQEIACSQRFDEGKLRGGDLLENGRAFLSHLKTLLHQKGQEKALFPGALSSSRTASAVLFLLSPDCGKKGPSPQPCVVLNKRSPAVKQPGDLCFPGGSIAPRLDPLLARLLTKFPFPLRRWPHWKKWREERPDQARRMALLFATSLRESFEEMRLNPLDVTFLGPLPAQNLVMFRRIIYPIVGWIRHQRRFFPNWEVERIVRIPLRQLLEPEFYATYRLRLGGPAAIARESPCFIYQDGNGREVLWGATFRIVMAFLELVFGFRPPENGAVVVEGVLDEIYYEGVG